MKKHPLLLLLFMVNFSVAANSDDWFFATPLQASYQALVSDNPIQAWAELVMAMRQHDIASQHWLPLKQAIITNSECGQSLDFFSQRYGGKVKLSLQQKANLVQKRYQAKVSLFDSLDSVAVKLTDRFGQVWLQGETSQPEQGYSELESSDWIAPLKAGLYVLSIDDEHVSLLLDDQDGAAWISLINQSQAIKIEPPKAAPRCLPAAAQWQWFDENYQLVGENLAMRTTVKSQRAMLPKSIPVSASWLSGVVLERHYQSGVVIEHLQRLTLPAQFLYGDTRETKSP